MATLSRRPLAPRPLHLHIPAVIPQLKATGTFSGPIKRARSPETAEDNNAPQATPPKRARGTHPSPAPVHHTAGDSKDKELRRAEREAQKAEFRIKYTRAFPGWVFYFDLDILDPESAASRRTLESKVSSLGARIHDFFSNEVTHLITNQPVPMDSVAGNKENFSKSRLSKQISSPSKTKARGGEGLSIFEYDHLVKKALGFGMKIWSTAKLDSVLERCLAPTSIIPDSVKSPSASVPSRAVAAVSQQPRPLSRLLQSERLHGTSERDPTQKRYDFHYFSRSSFFVLVEDLRQELATIAAFEYTAVKGRDGKLKPTWPILHCHPRARGPFIEFDEREKRRWERSMLAESSRVAGKQTGKSPAARKNDMQPLRASLRVKRNGDLRRSVSMNNLHRRTAHCDDIPPGIEADIQDSANASGYLASTGTGGTYMAASGNSVGITSTTGTTSTAGNSLRNLQLPAALRGRIQQHVVTSRKHPTGQGANATQAKSVVNAMGPPEHIPDKPAMLRKSRSTNTMRLPKREEGTKPGYCENCRMKFDDFKMHIGGRRHRKFAIDDANFLQLDFLLSRVQRHLIKPVEEEEQDVLREWRRRDDRREPVLPELLHDQTARLEEDDPYAMHM